MKEIDIVIALEHKFPKNWNWFDKVQGTIIKWWTKSTYFHVEIIVDNTWISAETNGVVLKPLKPFKSNYKYYILKVPTCLIHLKRIQHFIKSLEGVEYDWKGVFLSQGVPMGLQKDNKLFCSELVVKVLQLFVIKEFAYMSAHNTSPGDINKLLQGMYKGFSPTSIPVRKADAHVLNKKKFNLLKNKKEY